MKRLLAFVFLMGCFTISMIAQKTTQVQYQETQARLLDVSSNAYVKPLTVELKVKGNQRIREVVKIPRNFALVAMKADPSNWRSYAVYEVSKRMACDVIVAATFNIKYDEVAGDQDVQIEVVGYPVDFTNWQTASTQDLEWIRMEKTITTAEREKIAAAVKTPTK